MHELLKIQLLDLPASGWQWHGNVSRQLLENEDLGHIDALHGLCRDVRWDVDLQRRGDCYHLQGRWHARADRHCSRCNVCFEWGMQGESLRDYHLAATDHGVDADGDACLDEALTPPGRVTLLDVLREDIWLAWRPVVMCRADCKGLCPYCGKSLNEGPCACPVDEGDHPFAVLRTLKLDK